MGRLLFPVTKVGRGHRLRRGPFLVPDDTKILRMGVRKRVEEQRIHNAEHGGGGADDEKQNGHQRQREAWTSVKKAQCKAKIEPQLRHDRSYAAGVTVSDSSEARVVVSSTMRPSKRWMARVARRAYSRL